MKSWFSLFTKPVVQASDISKAENSIAVTDEKSPVSAVKPSVNVADTAPVQETPVRHGICRAGYGGFNMC